MGSSPETGMCLVWEDVAKNRRAESERCAGGWGNGSCKDLALTLKEVGAIENSGQERDMTWLLF